MMGVYIWCYISSAASFALKTIDDYASQCGTKAVSFVNNEFYVDGGLTSVSAAKETRDLIETSKALCLKDGFKLNR